MTLNEVEAAVLSAFPAMELHHQGPHTMLTGLLDRSGGVRPAAEIDALGLDLPEIQSTPRTAKSPEPGDSRSPLQPLPSDTSGPPREGSAS